jgi:CHASE3 domain sensor protein
MAITLLFSGGVGYQSIHELKEDAAWVAHTHEVLDAVQVTLTTMDDAETGQRGYLITHDPRYLEPFLAAQAKVGGNLQRVKDLVRDNPQQERSIQEIEPLVTLKLKELNRTKALADRDPEAARREVMTHLGKNTMDAIRGKIEAMTRAEQTLLLERQRKTRQSYQSAVLSAVVFARWNSSANGWK